MIVVMKILNYEIFDIHADFCKTLANSKRLIIITALEHKELSVGEISKLLNTSLATTSQHLKILRDKEIVKVRKDAQKVYYYLNDKGIVYACNKIREIIVKINKNKSNMITENIDVYHLIEDD